MTTAKSTRVPLPHVRIISNRYGDHVEPALEASWTGTETLAWHAAIVRAKTGLNIHLYEMEDDLWSIGITGKTRAISRSAQDFGDVWTYLNGIETGAEYATEAIQ